MPKPAKDINYVVKKYKAWNPVSDGDEGADGFKIPGNMYLNLLNRLNTVKKSGCRQAFYAKRRIDKQRIQCKIVYNVGSGSTTFHITLSKAFYKHFKDNRIPVWKNNRQVLL